MRILLTFLLISFLSFSSFAQKDQLTAFEPLIGGTWVAEGKWSNGSIFKQEVSFRYDLSGNVVIAETKGFTDKDQTVFGKRNHGIRKYDPATKQIRFWEFDAFNGLTEGIITILDKNLYYQYTYEESLITDGWEYQDENTYQYKIGVYAGGRWEETYLNTTFTREK